MLLVASPLVELLGSAEMRRWVNVVLVAVMYLQLSIAPVSAVEDGATVPALGAAVAVKGTQPAHEPLDPARARAWSRAADVVGTDRSTGLPMDLYSDHQVRWNSRCGVFRLCWKEKVTQHGIRGGVAWRAGNGLDESWRDHRRNLAPV